MHRGNIKIFRKIMECDIYKDSILLHIFLHLLLNAKTKETKEEFKGTSYFIKAGSLIVTTQEIATQLNITRIMAYRKMLLLQEDGMINIIPQSHCSIIEILKYEEYQGVAGKIEDSRVLTSEELDTVMRGWGKVQPQSFRFSGKWSAAMVGKARDRLEGKTFKYVKSHLLMNKIFLTDELFCELEVSEVLDEKRMFLMNRR